ncbi:condensin complex subunit 1-like [Mizuhopecten yessoensis]|uniref:Condensin complex subunit 1 n=1 Tax=Mizuhopecten yessoensis TaxID=6573 RepID=A0A210PG18_MIZYE|nr:condensin complex subunit 1-like [Mizuhopecten yessoensis]OWF35443.1 Condensin complex subunit 1 [Mizuhopecten yessoensis]
MSFEFLIPVARDDLLNKTDVSQFVVDEVLSPRELPGALHELKTNLRAHGARIILENFDVLFSVLCLQKDLPQDLKEDAWELVVKITKSLSNDLANVLEDAPPVKEEKKASLNMVKMVCYLLCQYMEMLDAEDSKPSATQLVNAKGRAKSNKSKKGSTGMDWDEERGMGLKALLHLVSLNIHRLWDPPIPNEEFVNLVTNCCYKLFENPGLAYASAMETRQVMNHILAVMVKSYNHSLGCSLKVVQLVQHFEHLVVPLAQTLQVITEEFGVKTVLCEITREIGRLAPEDAVKDSAGTRNCSTFLVEIADRIPAFVLPNMSLLLCHLDSEPYIMRNCVLGVIGEILIKVLNKDGLDDKTKATRDQFLDNLEDHVHDTNAYVRSKCLQIWTAIVNEKCLPLSRQVSLTTLVVGRLQDKSSSVRKQALLLVTNLFKCNPYAAKFSVKELEQNYENEAEKLKQMMKEEEEENGGQGNPILGKLEADWRVMEIKISEALLDEGESQDTEEKEEEEGSQTKPSDPLITDEDTPDSVTERVMTLLMEEKRCAAHKLMTAMVATYPDLTQEASQQSERTDSQDSSQGDGSDIIQCLKKIFMRQRRGNLELAAEAVQSQMSEDQCGVVSDVSKQQVLTWYLRDTLAFAVETEKAFPVICRLLGSENVSDVLGAVEFFVTGFKFGLSSAMQGVRRMLPLIWSKESGVKDAVVDAYKKMYLSPEGNSQRACALAVVKNLSALTFGVTIGDLTSLEGLMMELMKTGDLESTVMKILWERFTLKIPDTSAEDSRAAILLLSMAAGADNTVVRSNINVMVSEGLGPRAESDFMLARDTCLALLKLSNSKRMKGQVAGKPFRLPQDHDMFTRLSHILVKGVADVENRYWIPLAEQAVKVIYKLSNHPDAVCGEIIRKVINEFQRVNEADKPSDTPMDTASDTPTDTASDTPTDTASNTTTDTASDTPTDTQTDTGPSVEVSQKSVVVLTRVLSLAGQVAFSQMVYLESDVLDELKRRRASKEDSGKTPARQNKKARESSASEAIEEELGLAGAAAEDAEAEYIRKVCERDIVTGKTLLGALAPVIVAVCTNQAKYSDPELQTAASLALSKFMMVSSEFCDTHLQLLFTILEKTSHATIRANIIIALGDLTFRFPNMIEPWTPRIYARLRDESTLVRQNTLQVLTHLILDDMVKVKGQISEMATCLVDHNEKISSSAKIFFTELSKKGNAIYNIMPDLISRLSDPDVGVDEEHFRTILRYLFAFIQKDRQCESLVEKLCQRFRAARNERQWRDLSFCLSMLSYNEKSLRKLQENFVCFADKLADDDVYSCFVSIITKSQSSSKLGTKVAALAPLLTELEERLERCHNKGMEDDEITQKASQASQRGKTPRKTPARKGKAGRRTKKVISDSEDDDPQENKTPIVRRQTQRKAKPKVSFDSDEDSDLELFDLDKSCTEDSQSQESASQKTLESSDEEDLMPVKKQTHRGGKKKTRPLLTVNSPR